MQRLRNAIDHLREELKTKDGIAALFSATGPVGIAIVEEIAVACVELDKRICLIAQGIDKKYTLGEAAKLLGVTEVILTPFLNDCAPGFTTRPVHHLTQAEIDCLGKKLHQENLPKPA